MDERDARRKSTPFSFGMRNLDEMDGLSSELPPRRTMEYVMNGSAPPIPFAFRSLDTVNARPSSRDQMDVDTMAPPQLDRTGEEADTVAGTTDYISDSVTDRESFESWLDRRWNSSQRDDNL